MTEASITRLREAVELFRGGPNWDLWQHVEEALAEVRRLREELNKTRLMVRPNWGPEIDRLCEEAETMRDELAQESARAAGLEADAQRWENVAKGLAASHAEKRAELERAAPAHPARRLRGVPHRNERSDPHLCRRGAEAMTDPWELARDAFVATQSAPTSNTAVERLVKIIAAAMAEARAEALAEIEDECTRAWKRGWAEALEAAAVTVEDMDDVEARGDTYHAQLGDARATRKEAARLIRALSPPAQPGKETP